MWGGSRWGQHFPFAPSFMVPVSGSSSGAEALEHVSHVSPHGPRAGNGESVSAQDQGQQGSTGRSVFLAGCSAEGPQTLAGFFANFAGQEEVVPLSGGSCGAMVLGQGSGKGEARNGGPMEKGTLLGLVVRYQLTL